MYSSSGKSKIRFANTFWRENSPPLAPWLASQPWPWLKKTFCSQREPRLIPTAMVHLVGAPLESIMDLRLGVTAVTQAVSQPRCTPCFIFKIKSFPSRYASYTSRVSSYMICYNVLSLEKCGVGGISSLSLSNACKSEFSKEKSYFLISINGICSV